MTDSVEVGVTHQIKIDRQDAWIKTSVTLDVPDGHLIGDAIDEASEIVNKKVLDVIEQTVATVQKFKTEKGV